jgi:hypothetical protein
MTISEQSFTEPGPDALADKAREHTSPLGAGRITYRLEYLRR